MPRLVAGLIVLVFLSLLAGCSDKTHLNEQLLNAADKGDDLTVTSLLAQGADPNASIVSDECNVEGTTALMLAALGGHLDIVKDLHSKGANINAVNGDMWSALMYTSSSGHADIVEYLVDNGVNVNIKDVELGVTPLIIALSFCHSDVAGLLVKCGASINEADNKKRTPLSYAAQYCDVGSVSMLLSKGANINTTDIHEMTALHYAAFNGRSENVSELIDAAGSDIGLRDEKGFTPLLWAIGGSSFLGGRQGHLDSAKLLIGKGADVNTASLTGYTPLMAAVKFGDVGLVKLLIDKGADVSNKHQNGWTALSISEQEGKEDIVMLLRKAGAQ